jgi:hypothetical protein
MIQEAAGALLDQGVDDMAGGAGRLPESAGRRSEAQLSLNLSDHVRSRQSFRMPMVEALVLTS